MAALPYMQLYVADYLADTAHLSAIEHGAYLLLMFNYWQRGESFKAKDEQSLNRRLATVARLSNDEWEDVKETLAEFFEVSEKEWSHRRIERDLQAVNEKSTKAKAAGRASGKKRSTSTEQTLNERSTDAEQTLNHTEADTDTDKDIKTKAAASQVPTSQEPADDDAALPEVLEDNNKPSGNPLSGLARRAGEITQLLRQRGAHLQPGDPRVKRWAEEDRTDVQLLQALEIAQQRRESSRSTAPINAGYLDSILADVVAGPAPGKPAARPQIDDWYRSDAGIDRKGRELGMYAHGGESYPAFRDRIWQRIRETENSLQEATS